VEPEPKDSSPNSWQPANRPYPEPSESTPQPPLPSQSPKILLTENANLHFILQQVLKVVNF
jgi:hypothetical protein